MNDKRQRRVLLGEISGAHGIRGDVLVRSFTAAPETIASYGPLIDATGAKQFSLGLIRVTSKGIVARIGGVSDRTTAETLRGTKLYIDRERLPEAAASEYYHADLIGLRAIVARRNGTRGDRCRAELWCRRSRRAEAGIRLIDRIHPV